MKSIKLYCLLCLSLLTACEQPSTAESVQTEPPGLVLAVPPYEMPSRIQQRFEPLLAYLSEALNQPVTLHISSSYEDQVKRFAEGQVDLAYMGPSSYLKARDNFNQPSIQLIAAESPYRAALVVHQNSNINQLSDLAGRSLAFGSYHSYSGHYIVRQMLRLQQVYLRDLQFYSFLGRHERAIMSVVHKDFDAAATTEGLAQRFIDLGYPLRILATSELLAPTVFVARAQLDNQIVETLRDALLFASETQKQRMQELGLTSGFFEVDTREFNEVKQIIDAIDY